MSSPSSSTSSNNTSNINNTNEHVGNGSVNNTLPPLPSHNSSSTSLSTSANSSLTPLPGVDGLALKENHPYGAAFSLASLDQGNSRGSLSLMNLNVGFDHTVFLKSGSFESLNALLFGKDGNTNSLLSSMNPTNISNSIVASTTPTPSGTGENKSNVPSINGLSSPTSGQVQQPISLPLPISLAAVNNPNGNISPSSPASLKNVSVNSIPSNVISTGPPTAIGNQIASYGNNALIQPKESEKRLVERRDDNSKFVDVTPFLTLPQHEAAKKLGIPSSTLAKRWKEASCNRKWPYRTVSKLDKEILTLLKNVENAKAELSPSVEATLGLLLKRRQEELKTVLVRL